MRLPKSNKIVAMKYSVGLSQFKDKVAKIKMSANESALGPSPRAIKEYLKLSKSLKRYPDSDGVNLKNVLAKKFKLDSNKIILGSGSDQILELICKAFLKKGDDVVVPEYSFLIYRLYSKINGANVLYSSEKNFTVSVEDILKKVTKKTKIVFIANPNNPTGTYIEKKELIVLRKKLRSNILLVIDDAYFEYVKQKNYSSGLKLFSNFRNVVVTRTFSKIYGLAGLRVGWGYGSKEIINSLNLVKPPFNINSPALSAAEAAIKDNAWLNKEIKHVNKWNDKFYKEFKKMNIDTNKSFTNFLLINFDKVKKNSNKIFKLLANTGILVRKMNSYGIKNSLRVTIGKSYENKKLILKIKKATNV
ncbi:histidinol-phosphate transaminase [Pelagibacteraceae bacterium]|jgi:histidinol-phosphate aminotransferase|nr:histidinol-phosphate transaminase [Pelagibacteraceae bacterium]